MPFYDFVCRACQHSYELRTSMSELARQGKPKCPACGSAETDRKLVPFSVGGKATDQIGPCGGEPDACGMRRDFGDGACGRGSCHGDD